MFRPDIRGLVDYLSKPRGLLAPLTLCLAFCAPAQAQMLRPPSEMRDASRSAPELAQGVDAAGMMLRIDRLENQVRGMTGQLEQMQFQNRRLEEQVKKFQQDVEFRFQENGRGAPAARPQVAPSQGAPAQGRRTDRQDGPGPSPTVTAAQGETLPPLSGGAPTRLGRRGGSGDAFDPDNNPGAPGAPRQLGAPLQTVNPQASRQLSGPFDDDEADLNAPVDLMRRPPLAPSGAVSPGAVPQISPQNAPPQMATLAPPTPREEYDKSTAALRGGQYEAAETGFRSFLQKFPKSGLVPDATFNLGESYYRRQRPREAAEHYLKITTDYSKSQRAPEALVKLGLSLEKLGAKEQACAAYSEVGRKYPNANASVRASAERETKRAQC